MKYQCINHIDKFHFQDASIEEFQWGQNTLTLELLGLVIRYNNPVNELLTDRYLDHAQIRFLDAIIDSITLEGPKYYSADDVLLEKVPDVVIAPEEYETLFKKLPGAILFIALDNTVSEEQHEIELAMDVEKGDDELSDTYWIKMHYSKAITEWERYLNKAQI